MKTIRSLLIVDDNEGDIVLCKLLLEEAAPGSFPYVMTASDGEEALAMFAEYNLTRERHPGRFPPVAILLDINMPKMDGFEFLEAFSKLQEPDDGPPSVVLMVTSSSDDRDRKAAAKFEMVKKFLVKPPSQDDIRELVEEFGE